MRSLSCALLAMVGLAVVCGTVACGTAVGQTAEQFKLARQKMVQQEIAGEGVKRQGVLMAMSQTPRHEFVPAELRKLAYFDMALPIGEQQTISPPYMVAWMTEKLDPQPTDKVLEIGTGSGYQAAIMAALVKQVYTIEIKKSLGKRAAEVFTRLGYRNIQAKIGDGYQGWAEHAPFDKIIVTCSPESIPQPLVEQLREGGLMIIPLGEQYKQTLYLMRKTNGKLTAEALEPTFFVPMTGMADGQRKPASGGPLSPLLNGSFDLATVRADRPDYWYYVRQAELFDDGGARGKCLMFHNEQPGRGSQALQVVGVDGRQVKHLDVSAWVRGVDLGLGVQIEHRARILLTFFDDDRVPVGQEVFGPWEGTFDWSRKSARLKVPKEARAVIVAAGLLGGTGELSLDDIELRAAAPQTAGAELPRR